MSLDSQADRDRVTANIGALVVEFCRAHVGDLFNAAELRAHVTRAVPAIAPESPGRILRELKARGVVHYELVSRSRSLYRVVRVA